MTRSSRSKAKTASTAKAKRAPARKKTAKAEAPGAMRRARTFLAGCLLALGGVFLLVSILTHNPLDPSWDVAGEGAARNWMGPPGAAAGNLALQSLGWGAGGAAFVFLVWGGILLWRGPRPRPVRITLTRWIAGMIGIAGFCAALAAMPEPQSWPFASLGGVVGDMLLPVLGAPATWLDLPSTTGMGAGFGLLLMALGGYFTFGLRPRDFGDAADAAGGFWATLRVWADGLRERGAAAAAYATKRGDPIEREDPPLRKALRAADKAENEPVEEDDSPAPAGLAADVKIAPAKKRKASGRAQREAQGSLAFARTEGFDLPRLDLLKTPDVRDSAVDEGALRQNAELLQGVLSDFGVKGEIVKVHPGPVVTLYEFEPAPGVKSSRVINLADDIARSMSTLAARVAVVPGRNAIGIELPNAKRETVFLRALFNSKPFEDSKAELPMALGETIGGDPFIADLARMPHLLIAGTTGSGKSVGINAMILSLLYRLPPEDCRLIMIDPKMLELSVYDGIPHLLSPVVTDPKKAVVALKWAVREMESRYLRMSKIGVRNVAGFNERVAESLKTGEPLSRAVQTGYDKESGEPLFETETIPSEKMPYIVVVIDEMADLMMVAGKEIESAVQRLAQMARAAGIHLVTATQRPSVDVITGTIKANFPTRISYAVTSKIDSRTILGEQGAEQLLGMGDLLYMASGGRLRRLHGPFVSDREVEAIANYLKKQGAPEYLDAVTLDDEDEGGMPGMDGFEDEGTGDSLFDQAVAVVARDRKASTSYIQRRLQIGYNRAATLIERMEEEGMIGPANHAGKREILLPEPGE
jgi:S-DNA-T family DNA segregation ATPase FtsK/SpoIIIE